MSMFVFLFPLSGWFYLFFCGMIALILQESVYVCFPHAESASLGSNASRVLFTNPSVGAVVINSKGEIVGEGVHWQSGASHAEVIALKHAGAFSLGASLYVTLVPCHHHGKTPPCTSAIIEAGIAHVYYAYEDPSEAVQTHTSRLILEAAGIHVHFTPMQEVTEFYHAYHHWCRYQRPWLDVKLVHSENGALLTITVSLLPCPVPPLISGFTNSVIITMRF